MSRADEPSRLAELDAYWADVARCVKEGDFKGYEASVRPDGVLVTGIKKQSYPLAKALARWKKEFDDTKAGTRKSNLTIRFSQRLGDETTAHETGIFLYTTGTQVLSVLLFDKSDEGNFEVLSSIGLILVVVTVAVVLVGFRLVGRDFMLRRTAS